MSFGGLFDGDSGGGRFAADMPYGSSAVPAGLLSQPLHDSNFAGLPKSMFSSAGLSLGLSNLEGQGDFGRLGPAGGGSEEGISTAELDALCRNKEDENDSRSGSDNLEGGSGDELEENSRKKKRYHRHTPNQIQELEGLFKECPHPDEKQRLELSRRLGLETRQVNFWFQNRRTQMKTQLERHENTILRQENDKLRSESISIRDAIRNPICTSCGGPAVLGEVSLEEQHLRIENARLKDELDRICSLAGKFLGRPISALGNSVVTAVPSSSLELGIGGNGFVAFGSLAQHPYASVSDYVTGVSSPLGTVITPPSRSAVPSVESSLERSMFLELALSAMDELVKMAELGEPLWVPSHESNREVLNYEHYEQVFSRCIGAKEADLVSEATRETAMVIINSLALVETLMDARDTTGLTTANRELKLRLQAMEQLAHLRDALNEALREEVQGLKITTTQIPNANDSGFNRGLVQAVSPFYARAQQFPSQGRNLHSLFFLAKSCRLVGIILLHVSNIPLSAFG